MKKLKKKHKHDRKTLRIIKHAQEYILNSISGLRDVAIQYPCASKNIMENVGILETGVSRLEEMIQRDLQIIRRSDRKRR